MSYGRRRTKTITETGVVSDAGVPARLIFAEFNSDVAGNNCILKDGGTGGTAKFTLKSGTRVEAKLGPFDNETAPVFGTDIYATITGTNPILNVTYEELA